MKNLLYIGILAIGLSSCSLSAQDNNQADHRARCQTQWMQKELHLKSNQVNKVEIINSDIERKLEDYKYKSTDVDDIMKKAKELDVERAQKLEDVLSPEQLFRFERLSARTRDLAGTCILSTNSQ